MRACSSFGKDLMRKRNAKVKSEASLALLYVWASKAFSALALNLHVFLLFLLSSQKKRRDRGYLPLFM
jgi:hypothetical protein